MAYRLARQSMTESGSGRRIMPGNARGKIARIEGITCTSRIDRGHRRSKDNESRFLS
jgi:hypothetical protein